ncbi:MAG TPA: hypothetical protein DCZ01_06110 [Elusimicrobia bacterium]|nr:MAG: hypothetical protein A2X37_10870 [Elusimicrobia bacterium GWA2_66_18]OGR69521.1 MAG: hypothetical protein A2X40_12385 [Elusimicrobia bacterium GWC2_65_9]HAZ08089.1 hypothetical protein [Elusimicrobiota bacterium]
MTHKDERRQTTRILNEFYVVLQDDKGGLIDDHALAHDVSDKGFKVETNGVLEKGQDLRFRLHLFERQEILGRGRVVWVDRTGLALWGGVEFRSLPGADRRRLRRLTRPSNVKWPVIIDKAFIAAFWATASVVLWIGLMSPVLRGVMLDLAPKALAAVAMGWSLKELLRPRR